MRFWTKIQANIKLSRWILFCLLAIISGAVYWKTMCPGIGYWGDMAKFAFLGKVLGTAHISVYPNYTVLNHIFVSLVPKGTLALRANLLSAVFAIFATWFLFLSLELLNVRRFVAFITALAFSFTYSIWMYSVVAEVYTLNVLFVIMVIYYLLVWNKTKKDRHFYLAAFSFSFSFGNHLTMIGLLPAFAYCVWVTDRKTFTDIKKILIVVGIILAGFLQYYYVIWRTNDPSTRFLETNTQSLINFLTNFHQDEAFTFTIGELILQRIPILAGYIVREFSALIVISIWGMISFRDRFANKFLGICILGEILFCLNINGRETWAFFIPVYIVLAIYLGLGIEDLVQRVARYPRLVYIALVIPLFFLGLNFQRNDQSNRVLHARMVEKALATVSQDGVIIVDEYDSACFFWYYLIGEDYEKNHVYAIPYYFPEIAGIKAYLRGEQPIELPAERISVQPGLRVYAYWTIADYLRNSGFTLHNIGNKYIFLVTLSD